MGLSVARNYLGPKGVARAHAHPRASELIYVEKGFVEAGFVDTNNRLFARNLTASDLFIIPRGVLHYLINMGEDHATVLAILNSENPLFQIPSFSLFGPKMSYKLWSFLLSTTKKSELRQLKHRRAASTWPDRLQASKIETKELSSGRNSSSSRSGTLFASEG
ncbi:germin-like protein 11-1 [Selaginella moellendorffii]|uniref:germin-like protein 11-1 n=1 Tax=Selaginella moellendorffii TaxID=88036 RepID=UPI000D1C4D78|nr:germin-like protein 11-1 [Selaginella moellendorffii]|eukprot:XP_024531298.1 germin-like protein 11-1 [Selaginella moellendorffii]